MDQQYGTHAPSAQQGQGARQNRPTFHYFDHSILHKNKIKHQTANTHQCYICSCFMCPKFLFTPHLFIQ